MSSEAARRGQPGFPWGLTVVAAVATLAVLLVVVLGPVLPTPLKEAVGRLRELVGADNLKLQ